MDMCRPLKIFKLTEVPGPVPGRQVFRRLEPQGNLVERPDAEEHLEAPVVAQHDLAEVRGLIVIDACACMCVDKAVAC